VDDPGFSHDKKSEKKERTALLESAGADTAVSVFRRGPNPGGKGEDSFISPVAGKGYESLCRYGEQ